MSRATDVAGIRSGAWRRVRRCACAVGMGCVLLWAADGLSQQPFPADDAPGLSKPVAPVSPVGYLEPPARERPGRALLDDPPISSIDPLSQVRPAEFSVETLLDEPLADVVVEGNTTIKLQAIMRYIESKPGRRVSARTIQQDKSKLLNTRWFLDVRPTFRESEAGPVLVFQVVERPILKSVQFVGNKKIKTGELQSHTGLRPNHGYDVSANRESVQRIKALYKERGYRFAEVTLEKGDSPDDREVIFVINEGPKVKVWDISFEGNKFSTGPVLKTKVALKTVKLWIIGGDYDPEIIRNDELALKEYYMNLGFFDVEVTSTEKFSDDKAKVYVTFQVTEGRRYKVRNIEVIGNDVISSDTLLTDLKMRSGKEFNARFLRQDVDAMKDRYDDQGRLFATVNPTPRFSNDEEGWVDLVYQIDEDVPRYIGTIDVHIRGDYPHSREEVVRQEVHRFLKPGQLARGRDMRMAKMRVNGSGLWDKSEPPVFDIKPVSGKDYYPQLAARGQSDSQASEEADDPHFAWLINPNEEWVLSQPDELFSGEAEPLSEISRPLARPAAAAPAVVALPDTISAEIPRAPVAVPRAAPASVPVHYEESSSEKTGGEGEYDSLVIPPELVFRGQSDFMAPLPAPGPTPRGQSLDGYGNPVPQDYLRGVSPQGDPFGDALSAAPPGFVDVNIDVTEGRTGRLMFGVGVNSDAGVVGSLVLQEDNFDILRPPTSWADIINGQAWRGAGQSFRMEAVPGSQVSRYLVSWQDPFFLRSDFSLGVSGFYYNRFYRNWTEDRLGGRISVGYVLDRYWSASTALRLENVDIRDVPPTAPADLQRVRGDNFLSTASATLAYDTRDNSFFPTQGHFANFTYEQGFGEFTYPRFDVSGGQYFTPYERPDGFGKHIFSLTGQLGWTGDSTPIFERYYAGGYSSFRGFAFRGVTPIQNGVEVGGNFMALGSAEYMVPITADDNIRAVVFSDFGSVEPDVGLDQFRASAGFGFRLIIPAMGPAPLAFDFAWPILREDFDRRRVFSFYVGFTR